MLFSEMIRFAQESDILKHTTIFKKKEKNTAKTCWNIRMNMLIH